MTDALNDLEGQAIALQVIGPTEGSNTRVVGCTAATRSPTTPLATRSPSFAVTARRSATVGEGARLGSHGRSAALRLNTDALLLVGGGVKGPIAMLNPEGASEHMQAQRLPLIPLQAEHAF